MVDMGYIIGLRACKAGSRVPASFRHVRAVPSEMKVYVCICGKIMKDEAKNMKVRASIKRRCENCQIIKRNGVVRVVCSRNPRHKQKQG